jgi:hypothetical protein
LAAEQFAAPSYTKTHRIRARHSRPSANPIFALHISGSADQRAQCGIVLDQVQSLQHAVEAEDMTGPLND